MSAAATRRHAAPFLPELTGERRTGPQDSRMKQQQSAPAAHVLSKSEISQFRNSLRQNVCVELLQDGCHRSFSELFFLLSCDQQRRAAAEPGSAVSLQTPLEEQRDKLEVLRRQLCIAERAERTASWSVVCEQRLALGRFFSAPQDLWLSLHFYHSCADSKRGGLSKPAMEARAHMAELYLQQGELERARQQAELCIKLAGLSDWPDSAGRPLGLRASQSLWRIYDRMADAPLDAGDYSQALTLLYKAHGIATESADKQIEAEASYRLGLTYQRAGDHTKAKQFFNTCMQIYGTLLDGGGLAKTYKAMVESIESEGNMDESIECLEKLIDICRSNGLQHNLADAHLCLGKVYCLRRQFGRASQLFLQGYEVANQDADVSLLFRAQVLAATARARWLIPAYGADVAASSPAALRRLLAWKSSRVSEGLGPDPSHSPGPAQHGER